MGIMSHTINSNINLINFRSAARVPITNLKVCFNPIQSGENNPTPLNVRPITGWSEIKAKKYGKNLYDVEEELKSAATYTIINNNIIVSNTSDNALAFVRFKILNIDSRNIGQTFTFSAKCISATANCRITLKLRNSDGTTFSTIFSARKVNYQYTFTVPNDFPINGYYSIEYYSNAAEENISGIAEYGEVQLEYGPTATEYEPPKNKMICASLINNVSNIIYGGYIDLITGELVEEWKELDLSNINWNYINETNRFESSDLQNVNRTENIVTIMSDSYTSITNRDNTTFDTDSNDSIICFDTASSSPCIILHDSRFTSGEDLKSALENSKIIYKLAMPIHYSVTPTQLVACLDKNNIWCDTNGAIEVSYVICNSIQMYSIKQQHAGFQSNYALPKEYLEVACIGAENAVPYIDTGIYLTGELQTKIHYYNDKSEAFLFGARKSTSAQFCNFNINKGGTSSRFDYATKQNTSGNSFERHDGEFLFTFLNRKSTLQDLLSNYKRTLYGSEWGSTLYAEETMLLFAVKTGQNLSIGSNTGNLRIYSAQFWLGGTYSDGVITGASFVRDFIPCIRRADGVVGMYDKITKQFFTSANSDIFVARDAKGNIVTL